ncbi:MAG TPA: LysR family transcriptional regulator [Candidatus Pullilachnospira intestinigallinarum]|nr:LysR family transcriptional regulator [Candidatus Pullilachnospira intestinigallinarum]
MTIRHLKIFLAVAETGKMSEAAARLYISQPTVSQAIRELETHYNTRLFERLSKKLYITPAGKELYASAQKVVQEFEQLERNMEKGSRREILRLGASITVGTCLVPALLKDFETAMPQVQTTVHVTNTHSIEEMLLNSQLDLAVVEGDISSPDLIAHSTVEDYLVMACSLSHPFALQREIPVSALDGQDYAMREEGSGTRALFEEFALRHNLRLNIRWEANCPATIRQAVIHDRCLAVMSVRLLSDEIRAGLIHPIRNPSGEWNRQFRLVYHKNKYLTPSMECFRDILSRYRHPEDLSCSCPSVLV